MHSIIKIFGHPVHPMLVPFPIAFYTATLVCSIVYSSQGDPFWFRVAYAANVAGVVMAVVAGLAGFMDLVFGIPSGTLAKKHGYQHMAFNGMALVFFVINLWLNSGQWNVIAPVMKSGIILPLVGVLCMLAAGYLGWTLVQTHHVGIRFTPAEQKYVKK